MKKIILSSCFMLLLCGCSANEASLNNSHETTNTNIEGSVVPSSSTQAHTQKYDSLEEVNTMSSIKKLSINFRPQIGEKFIVSHIAKSGNLYLTVNSAECYTNVLNDKIDTSKFTEYNFNNSEIMNLETGEIQSIDGTEYYFILVNITIENEDALANENDMLFRLYKEMKPELFSNKYCDEYDFSAKHFFCSVKPKQGARDMNNIGGSLDYFSLLTELYKDEYRKDLFLVEPGKSISFDVGSFVPKYNANDDLVALYGGDYNEKLISRVVLCTSNSIHDPVVELGLG